MIRYITRWALTSGIRMANGHYSSDGKTFWMDGNANGVDYRDAFESLDLAHQATLRMAARRISKLEKELARLRDPAWRAKVVGAA